jgi:hypothetical protein
MLALVITGCGSAQLSGHEVESGSASQGLFGFFHSRPDPVKDCKALGQWLATHGKDLTAEVERPGFIAKLEYRPAACLACMEDHDALFADSTFIRRVSPLRTTELYVLKIFVGKAGSDSLYLELSESLLPDLVEVVGTDTVPCAFMHVEAMPSMMHYRSALIGFDRPQDGKDRSVVLRDSKRQFGGDLVFGLPKGGVSHYFTALADTLTSIHS